LQAPDIAQTNQKQITRLAVHDGLAHLSVDIHKVPGVLELADIIVAQQCILFIGVEQGEVLHDDSCRQNHHIITSVNNYQQTPSK